MWNTASATRLDTPRALGGARQLEIASLAFSPDGTALFAGGGHAEPVVRRWDLATATATWTASGHVNTIAALAVTRDGQRLVSASRDYTIRVWNAATGRSLRKIAKAHEFGVRSIAFASDETLLASGGYDYRARTWNPATWERVAEHEMSGPVSVAFTPAGDQLAVAGDTKIALCSPHLDPPTAVVAAPQGDRPLWSIEHLLALPEALLVATHGLGAADSGLSPFLRISSANTRELLHQIDDATWAIPATGTRFWTVVRVGDLDRPTLFDAILGTPVDHVSMLAVPIASLAASRDGKALAAGCIDGTICVWRQP